MHPRILVVPAQAIANGELAMVREIMALGILAATEAVFRAINKGEVHEESALHTLEVGTSAAALEGDKIIAEILSLKLGELSRDVT